MDRKPEETARHNYYRLFMLRNAEITAIGLGIAVAVLPFGLPLPLQPLLAILALIIGVNVYTWYRLRTGSRFGNNEIFALMLLDVAGLTAVFFYTGGATNPFVWFYLLPLMIAATILSRWQTWSMAVITVLCYSALFFIEFSDANTHAHHDHGGDDGFAMHVLGMWLGFVMSAGIVAVIIVGMAHSLRERDRRLAEAREESLKNERLVALGTLAAGTAHELGTPLGTMAILTAELERACTNNGDEDLKKKLGIISDQIKRCKNALSVLSASAGAQRAESGCRMQVEQYLEEVLDTWRQQRPGAHLHVDIGKGQPDATILAERTLTQALINILNNGADASPEHVTLNATWTSGELTINITDRGPGLSDEIHSQLGKAPVTTKSDGLGVGLYLAHATITRLGGSLSISNREGGGTVLSITLPLLTDGNED
ncbi:MAG: ATP-binding protein [Gammaproteobacteria bacterium]